HAWLRDRCLVGAGCPPTWRQCGDPRGACVHRRPSSAGCLGSASSCLFEAVAQLKTPRRLITGLMIAALVAVAVVQISNPHSYLSEVIARVGGVGSGNDAPLTDLRSIDQLESAFNGDGGHARLLLL